MDHRREKIGILMLRFLERKLEGENLTRFLDWVFGYPENKKHYLDIKSIYDERENDINVKESWMRLTVKLEKKEKEKRRIRRNRMLYIAAAVVPACILAVSLYMRDNANASLVVYSTSNSSSKIEMPDGTVIRIAPNSSIKYKSNYEVERRDVYLQGEAYFEVKKNKNKPFVVISKDQSIVVTGTKFNVRSYSNDKEFVTTLKEGSITFKSNTLDKQIDLKPGEQIKYDRNVGTLTVCKASLDDELSWLDNKYIFVATPISDILSRMGHVYNCRFICKNDRVLRKKFSGAFYGTDNEAVFIDVIHSLTGLDYYKNNDTVVFK